MRQSKKEYDENKRDAGRGWMIWYACSMSVWVITALGGLSADAQAHLVLFSCCSLFIYLLLFSFYFSQNYIFKATVYYLSAKWPTLYFMNMFGWGRFYSMMSVIHVLPFFSFYSLSPSSSRLWSKSRYARFGVNGDVHLPDSHRGGPKWYSRGAVC